MDTIILPTALYTFRCFFFILMGSEAVLTVGVSLGIAMTESGYKLEEKSSNFDKTLPAHSPTCRGQINCGLLVAFMI
jgi:hypothetical protein